MRITPARRATSWRRHHLLAVTVTSALVVPLLATPAAGEGSGGGFDATIRRDSFGVPHVVADDYPSLGYGIGYAFAEDNICTLMDFTVTVRGERSRFFGPDATWQFHGNGTTNTNLASDFHYRAVNESGVIDRLLDQPVWVQVRSYLAAPAPAADGARADAPERVHPRSKFGRMCTQSSWLPPA